MTRGDADFRHFRLALRVGERLAARRAGIIFDIARFRASRFLGFRLGQLMTRGNGDFRHFRLTLRVGERLAARRAGIIFDIARFRASRFLGFRLGQLMTRGNGDFRHFRLTLRVGERLAARRAGVVLDVPCFRTSCSLPLRLCQGMPHGVGHCRLICDLMVPLFIGKCLAAPGTDIIGNMPVFRTGRFHSFHKVHCVLVLFRRLRTGDQSRCHKSGQQNGTANRYQPFHVSLLFICFSNLI